MIESDQSALIGETIIKNMRADGLKNYEIVSILSHAWFALAFDDPADLVRTTAAAKLLGESLQIAVDKIKAGRLVS